MGLSNSSVLLFLFLTSYSNYKDLLICLVCFVKNNFAVYNDRKVSLGNKLRPLISGVATTAYYSLLHLFLRKLRPSYEHRTDTGTQRQTLPLTVLRATPAKNMFNVVKFECNFSRRKDKVKPANSVSNRCPLTDPRITVKTLPNA